MQYGLYSQFEFPTSSILMEGLSSFNAISQWYILRPLSIFHWSRASAKEGSTNVGMGDFYKSEVVQVTLGEDTRSHLMICLHLF